MSHKGNYSGEFDQQAVALSASLTLFPTRNVNDISVYSINDAWRMLKHGQCVVQLSVATEARAPLPRDLSHTAAPPAVVV
jgi:hypothetical protein